MEAASDFEGGSQSDKRDRIQNAMTALKKRNAQLKRRLQKLELVFRNTIDILVVVDSHSGKIQMVSDAVEAVLGYACSDLIGKKLIEILPDDVINEHSHFKDSIPEFVDGVLLDQKLKCHDGSFKSMDMTTSLVDSSGFSAILLTFRDTSERKFNLQEMIKKNSALDSALSAMIITDSTWKIDYANLQALNYWRYSRASIIHLELIDLLSIFSDFDDLKSSIKERGQWEKEVECQRRDSTSFTAHATAVAVDNTDKTDPCYILSFLDITQRISMEKKLTELSLHDNLTGLLNRRGFMTFGRQLLNSSRRKQPKIGLLYVDIDYLKLINDELGHSVGDIAIETTAEILRNSFRDSDIIARLGGDEFVVLFFDTEKFTKNSITTRLDIQLKKAIETKPLPFLLSLSIGYHSTVLYYQTQIGRLLSRADALMYEDKKNRRELITPEDILLKNI